MSEYINDTDIEVGDTVIDRDTTDQTNPSSATVVEVTGVTARDYEIDALKRTVSAVNPDYPTCDPVILVAFESGETVYSYPASRLEVNNDDDTDDSDESSVGLERWTNE